MKKESSNLLEKKQTKRFFLKKKTKQKIKNSRERNNQN